MARKSRSNAAPRLKGISDMKTLPLFVTFIAILPLSLRADETKPYGGKPHGIPGKIEAEHWDLGKPDVAYHDVDEKNRGENYREATQVDIEQRSDASNGHGVGWTRKGNSQDQNGDG